MVHSDVITSLYGANYRVNDDSTDDAIKRMISEKEQKGAFYHLDISELVRSVKLWRLKLPRVTPHYAVKCNNTPAVLRTFNLLGLGFDCASLAEIKSVLSMGVDPERIVYAHPAKMASHIKYAEAKNVMRMTFDSPRELHKIAKLHPRAELLVRIRCDASDAMCQLGAKFGVHPEEAMPLLSLAAKLSLKVVGVAFHVGSGCREPQVFLRAIAEAKKIFAEAELVGQNLSVLDIGGGFLPGKSSNFDECADYINDALDLHFPEGCGVEVIAEPGRFLVSTAFTLATNIINRRDEGDDSAMFFVDDGIYGSFNMILYENHHPQAKPLYVKENEEMIESSVWGPTCDSADKLLSSVQLPKRLTLGDWLVWEEMGAYSMVGACNFNGFDTPPIVVHLGSNTVRFLEDYNAKSDGSQPIKMMQMQKKVLEPINAVSVQRKSDSEPLSEVQMILLSSFLDSNEDPFETRIG